MAINYVTTDGQTVVVSSGDTVVMAIPGGGSATIEAAPGANVKTIRIDYGDSADVYSVTIDLSTFSTADLHIDVKGYDQDDSMILEGAFGTHIEPGNSDEYQYSYVGADGETYLGYIRLKDKGEQDFTASPSPISICFAQGTIIDTDLGPTPIQALCAGNLVRTLDNGF